MVNSKEPIKLRKRKMTNGYISLYLDIYLNGSRSYEFLKLYLVPEDSRKAKAKNKETLLLAEAIKSKRIVELRNGEYGFKSDYKEDTLFFPYYKSLCEKRLGAESRSNWGNWRSALIHLEHYEKNHNITFAQINKKWIEGFRDYLEKEACAWENDFRKRIKDHPLSKNTCYSYFNKLRACLNIAFKERIIRINPMRGVVGIKEPDTTRMYLTVDEIKQLAHVKCEYPNIKRAFLFSCLTGLRRSDILRLKWSDVQKQGEFTRLIFRQKKTCSQEYLDIAPQAAELLGDRANDDDLIFQDIHSPSVTNQTIKKWVLRAGINKDITFHCARHTFAVMMLDIGTDIYTVSKLLGHRFINTTQIYAKVLDKNKQKAVAMIPDIL